ncbi:MAG: AAA family ATPase [Candidatus Limnocylindria bacterium]
MARLTETARDHTRPSTRPKTDGGGGFLAPAAPLELHVVRERCSLVGRPVEMEAIEQELAAAARGRLVALTLEGEPGIGKTRLVIAASELAEAMGFTHVAVTADEEIRGPFLIARSIFASEAAQQAVAGTDAEEAVERALRAITGRDDADLEGMPPDHKLLRAFDLAALALRALATRRPLALLLDDVQWADDDSLRMLRYVVRTDARSPIFILLAMRPNEAALVNETVTLLADMERMGTVRRLSLQRFSQVETTEFLKRILAAEVNASSAATMHAQAEGVPFIVEELARAYRDTGLLQQIDRTWTLARNAERLVPSSVRTLIQRRAARLPDETRAVLAVASVLGRSFSLRDVEAVRQRLGENGADTELLAERLAPATAAGLLVQHSAGSAADYSFGHEQVREFAGGSLSTPRKRAIHGAIVDLLTADGEPPAASLGLVAQHAISAGDAERAARFAVAAARAALEARAPEEALRLVELAIPSTSAAQDRVALLRAQDDALEMLRRPGDRLDGLAELAALAEALRDRQLELEVMLRRAAALRLAEDYDRAAALARRVRELAVEAGDAKTELAACIELSQALLETTLGETYAPSSDMEAQAAAEEPLTRAAELAERLGDEAALAAALRELGILSIAHVRSWFVDFVRAGRGTELLARIAGGETVEDIMPSLPPAPYFQKAMEYYGRALDIYERLGDRRGAMSSVIAMAYGHWAPDVHLTFSGRRIEEIRRLATRSRSFTMESERAQADVQMLYGVQVFAIAKVIPELALARGQDAYAAARSLGERPIEFSAAIGLANTHLELGEIDQAERWIDRAVAAAQAAPSPLRARRLEALRGTVCARRNEVAGMRDHFERAVRLATDQGRPAARCEALAHLALEAARLGTARHDEELMGIAEHSATEASEVAALLPGHPSWGAQADAALATVHLARGARDEAAAASRRAIAALQGALHEDGHLETLLPAARAMIDCGTSEEAASCRQYLQILVATIAQRSVDEEVRVRWFRGPVGRELTELAGPIAVPAEQAPSESAAGVPELDEADVSLLRLLTEGRTNREIAAELGMDEEPVVRRLAGLFARVGAASRGEATAFALRTV